MKRPWLGGCDDVNRTALALAFPPCPGQSRALCSPVPWAVPCPGQSRALGGPVPWAVPCLPGKASLHSGTAAAPPAVPPWPQLLT